MQKHIHSQSPVSPYAGVFESDDDGAVFCAVSLSSEQEPDVDDVIEIFTKNELDAINENSDIRIMWSKDGDKCALLINDNFYAMFDFLKKEGHTRNTTSTPESGWTRVAFKWTDAISEEFSFDLVQKRTEKLNAAIHDVKDKDNERSRLMLYRHLMHSTLYIPITGSDPEAKDNLYYIFPYDTTKDGPTTRFVLCTFTDEKSCEAHFGQFGIKYQPVKANHVFHNIQNYDVFAVLVTTPDGVSIVVERDEFPIISILGEPSSLQYNDIIKNMAPLLLKPAEEDLTQAPYPEIGSILDGNPEIKSAFLFRTTATHSQLTLGICVMDPKTAKLGSLYQNLISLLQRHQSDNEDDSYCVTLLEPNSFLHSMVKQVVTPFFKRETVDI
ncbi:MAG: DUF2251 domain-containing protein [bacterium]|nr:DUF2251 domain-containing protein [bacterium]